MSSRTTRVVRGLSAAAIATFVAGLSHVAAGGGAPGQAGALVALAFSALACIALAGRRLSVTRLTIAVLISQFAFHLLFEVGGGDDSGLAVATQQHHGHSVTTLIPDAAAGSSGQLAESAAHSHLAGLMWVSHAVAAVVTIVLLARGELVLRRLLQLARVGLDERPRWSLRLPAERALALVTLPVTENSSLRHRRRLFGSRVAPSLQEWMLTLGSLGHRGPPWGAPAHPFA